MLLNSTSIPSHSLCSCSDPAFLKHAKHTPTSGPLHLILPLLDHFLPPLPTLDIPMAPSLKALYASAETLVYYGHAVSSFSQLPPTSTSGALFFTSMTFLVYYVRYLFSYLLSISPHSSEEGALFCSLLYLQHITHCLACGRHSKNIC